MTGSITRRGARSWRIKFDIGRDSVTGKRQTRFHTFRGTKKEAEAERIRLLNGVNTQNYVDQSKTTVSEFLARWDRDWATDNLSAKTIERFRQLIALQIIPRLGAVKLQELKPVDVIGFYAALLREGRVRKAPKKADGEPVAPAVRGLSPTTVGQVHRVLHRALGHAVAWGLVRANVAAIAKPPKKVTEEVQILTADQVDTVLTKTKGAPLHSIIVVALGTGARRGEIMALRWRDIDFDGARARIERSLEQTKAGLRFKAPKTKCGRRNVALPAALVSELRAVWKAQQELRLALGMGKASPDDLVFSTPDGNPRKPDGVSRDWRQLVVSKKLPKVTFHALRHTHVSQLIANGTDIMTISRRIGHSSPVVTLGVYGHLFDNSDTKAASAIEASFGRLRTE